MIVRLRAVDRATLEIAFKRYGILHPDGESSWRPALGISIAWLGRMKVGADVIDPVTGEVILLADTDGRYHVDLLVTGDALAQAFYDYETQQGATITAVEALTLLWTLSGSPVAEKNGQEKAVSLDGIELVTGVRTPRHHFAGIPG